MSSKDFDRQTFRAKFDTLQIDAPTLQISPKQTIIPDAIALSVTHTLPEIRTMSASPDATGDLLVTGTIGEGGMGLIQVATQVALNRQVAIKTVRQKRGHDQGAIRGLLQEALVTGHLEHPNIIPVYNLGKDPSGSPLLVMKRIEGVSWLDVLLDARKAPNVERVDRTWHLRILISVCDAVRFAHSRGIVHRDIKPENIMIGGFGEVYLLDWGIALSIDEDDEERFPHRNRVKGLAGTPAYMAPEMTHDDALSIDFRTDVYLLGACLHEVLTGEGRHSGDSLFEIMFNAWNSDPITYSPDVPKELATIANKSMAVEPDNRYQTVDEFKSALLGYLEHRQSIHLTRESRTTLFKAEKIASRTHLENKDEQRLHDLFVEARFGFKQALKSWPDNTEAKEGLHRCLATVFRHHIERKELIAARAVLSEFMDTQPELEALLRTAVEEQTAEHQEVAKLRDFREQFDFSLGAKGRSAMAFALGTVWTISTLYRYPKADPFAPIELDYYVYSVIIHLVIPAILMAIMAPRIFQKRGGSQLIGVVIGTLLGIFTVRTLGVYFQLQSIWGSTIEWCIYGVGVIAIGAVSERRIALVGGTYFVAALWGAQNPENYLLAIAAAHIFVFGRMAYVWYPRKQTLVDTVEL